MALNIIWGTSEHLQPASYTMRLSTEPGAHPTSTLGGSQKIRDTNPIPTLEGPQQNQVYKGPKTHAHTHTHTLWGSQHNQGSMKTYTPHQEGLNMTMDINNMCTQCAQHEGLRSNGKVNMIHPTPTIGRSKQNQGYILLYNPHTH